MFAILATLAVLDLLFFGWTAAGGLFLDSADSIRDHLTWGIITAVLFSFTHCLVLFYLIGSGLDVKEALAERPDLAKEYVPWTRSLKRRVFPIASLAMLLIIVTALLGAHVHSDLLVAAQRLGLRPSDPPPLRAVSGWWAHGLAAGVAFLVHLAAVRVELGVVRENRRGIEEINERLDRVEDSAVGAGS